MSITDTTGTIKTQWLVSIFAENVNKHTNQPEKCLTCRIQPLSKSCKNTD